jgi:hypothetical protein
MLVSVSVCILGKLFAFAFTFMGVLGLDTIRYLTREMMICTDFVCSDLITYLLH